MTHDLLQATTPAQLLGLLRAGAAPSVELWEAQEFADIWRQQLHAPLLTLTPRPDASEDLGQISHLAHLLEHPAPPAELVRMLAQFAKSCVVQRGGDLPEEIARVLYFLMVGLGREAGHHEVSSLSPDALADGLRWAEQRDWLDATTRARIRRMLADRP